MAIFNNSGNENKSVAASNSTTTIITEGSLMKGEMTLSCDLYVDNI
jgi:cytoskeletal protein CcmA (bactofilin family)